MALGTRTKSSLAILAALFLTLPFNAHAQSPSTSTSGVDGLLNASLRDAKSAYDEGRLESISLAFDDGSTVSYGLGDLAKTAPKNTNCTPVYYSGVSAGGCTAGAAINNVVFTPSRDLNVSVVRIPGASEANVSIMDGMLNTVACTARYSGGGSILNATAELNANETYFITVGVNNGCARTPPGARTITPEGSWFVQDMWCSEGDYCPMAVELMAPGCGAAPPAPEAAVEAVEQSGLWGDGVVIYLLAFAVAFVIALLLGLIYSVGRRRGRGEVLGLFTGVENADKKR